MSKEKTIEEVALSTYISQSIANDEYIIVNQETLQTCRAYAQQQLPEPTNGDGQHRQNRLLMLTFGQLAKPEIEISKIGIRNMVDYHAGENKMTGFIEVLHVQAALCKAFDAVVLGSKSATTADPQGFPVMAVRRTAEPS